MGYRKRESQQGEGSGSWKQGREKNSLLTLWDKTDYGMTFQIEPDLYFPPY